MKKFFDDYIFYDPKKDEIWIGRPDTKVNNEPWEFFLLSGDKVTRTKGKPKHLIEIDRVPEFSIC